MPPRRTNKFEGLHLEPLPTVLISALVTRSLRSRTIQTQTSPCSAQHSIVPISESTIANGTPGDNIKILRSRTVKMGTSPCSGQLSIVPISEPTIANRTPGDNVRNLRSRTIKTETSPFSGQNSIVPISGPTIANGVPGDNIKILRSRTIKIETSPCSGQLSIVPISEPTIANGTPGDNTRSFRSHKIKTDSSTCTGQLSIVPISESTIANGTPGDNTRNLCSRTVKTDTSICSGQLSIMPISESTIANGTPGDITRSLRSGTLKTDTSPCSGQLSIVPIGDNTRSLRSRTVKTNTSPCSGQLSIMPISVPNIANGTPGDDIRSLCNRKVKTDTSPCSGQLSIVPISESSIANRTPGDNTRNLHSRTIKTETSSCSGQLSILPISEPERTPGDTVEERVKLPEEGLPGGWIKEVKLPGNALKRKHTFYVDPKTCYAFHSLEDALQYAQTGSILSCVLIPQKRSKEEVLALMNSPAAGTPCLTVKTQTAKSSSQVRLCRDRLLPGDWIKEEKSRTKDSNKKVMFYIDPKTGYAFRSVKDALRYVETGDILSCASKPQKRSMEEIRILSNHTIKTESSASPFQPSNLINYEKSGDDVCEFVQESQLTSYGLPKSWIKELRPRKDGIKMDPFYVDPDTGYAFLSLKDALRYLATGNIRSCVVRPRKRSIEEVQALISSSEISSISGMKTVQQGSLQLVQHDSLHRKRKRSPVKPSEWNLEDLKIKGDGATWTDSPRVKKYKEEPSCIKASPPGLLALKAKIMTNCDENHKEGPMLITASPHFAAPETKADITSLEKKNSMMSKSVLEPIPSSQPCINSPPSCHRELEHEEIIEGASGNSSGVLLWSGKMSREKPVPLRASSHLAAVNVATDASCVEHENGMTSNDLINSSPSSLSYENTRLTSDLGLKARIELVNNSSTKTPSCRGKVHRERRTPLRASSHISVQKLTTGTTSVRNEKSMMNNALLESSPSLSHIHLRSTSQPVLELEETIEASNSLTKKPSCRGKVHRERHTPLRALCRSAQNVTNDASVQNGNSMMSNALFEPVPSSHSYQNLGPRNQPDLELKEETMERANSSLMETPLRRGKMHRASSHLATMDVINDGTSVENKNRETNTAFFNQSPSFSFLNMTPASQPDLELKDKIQVANVISAGTSSQRGEKHTERSMPFSTSSRQAVLKRTTDCTYGENEDGNVTYSIFETRPPYHPDLNFGSTSLPDLELKEAQIQAANGSSTGTSLQSGKRHTERPMFLAAYSHQAAPKPTNDCNSREIGDGNVTNSILDRPPHPHPDLNLGSTCLPDMEVKEEVITAANARGSRTILQGEKLLEERSSTIINYSHLSTLRSSLGVISTENHKDNNEKRYAVSELPLSLARPDLNFGPTSQPYKELMEDAIPAVNDGTIRTTSWRVEPRREVPTRVDASPRLEALKVTAESNDRNRIAASALSEPSQYPGRPDLNLGPTSQLSVELQKEIENDSTTGNPLWRRNLHDVEPTPVIAMTQAPHCNYENNIKISNYFCGPVDSRASRINRGSTSQHNPGEVWHDTTSAAPSTVIAASKNAPDLNMVPMSWSEPEYDLERALKTNPGPKLEPRQQPVGVNTIGEFHLQSPVPSEIPYQDPTMDALLSGHEPGPSMPHMSIDALNSPVSPFFGDFWHDPCLSYAFKTLTGGVNQQQGNLGLGPENNVNWTSTRNGGPSENPSIGSSGTTSRTPQHMNHGTPQYMNHGTPQYMNNGTPQYMNHGTPQYMNNGTPQYMNNGTQQYMNNGTPQYMNNGMPQYMNNGMPFQK